uniref:Uncharacterized protein LOC111111101 isoform X3 n=1 Tax=Crassostrea virginica TaxID=6565 RepID=A0A8B8BJW4_CRAVI|nr:uncharacterized protein LOC111111101 isoform X3 [Crassostrea virginica]
MVLHYDTSSGSATAGNARYHGICLQESVHPLHFPVHEMPLPCGETCTAVGKKEQSCTPMDNTCVHDETMEKTETGDANDGAKYKQRKYFIVDTKDHEMIDR